MALNSLFVVVSRDQQTPPLTTSDKCHNLRDRTVVRRRHVDNTFYSILFYFILYKVKITAT